MRGAKLRSLEDKAIEKIFNNIQIGHENLTQPPEGLEEKFAKYVDDKNSNGDLVINMGKGYYRPYPFDPVDAQEFNDYISSEFEKANAIIERCARMNDTYDIVSEKITEHWRSLHENVG